ncbi:hypothetical protein NDU88_003745 [Pleurodeles waltl]|uniref:Uncharacterized protein n=1 Tax=Pleurodeles waltl TaxID=8319 RepID=A0AAV7QCK2_PLEWA|nr:hypothetical protein NDU88_003745 [Pleurodeles waltl]
MRSARVSLVLRFIALRSRKNQLVCLMDLRVLAGLIGEAQLALVIQVLNFICCPFQVGGSFELCGVKGIRPLVLCHFPPAVEGGAGRGGGGAKRCCNVEVDHGVISQGEFRGMAVEVDVSEEDVVLDFDGEWGNEVCDGVAEACSWFGGSVGEGAFNGGFVTCVDLKIQVLHDRHGFVFCGGAVD